MSIEQIVSWDGDQALEIKNIYEEIRSLTTGLGETNTTSNTGSAGIGIFKQKSGVDFELYKINSANSLLTIALNGTDKIDLTVVEGNINHDNLSGFVANEHIDHSSVSVTAGSGLSGGGTIASTRTIDLDINSLSVATIAAGDFVPFWDITATATNKKITFANLEGTLNHDSLAGFVSGEHFLQSAITVVGTIATGVWEATDVGVVHGGTGKSSWTQYLIPYADTTTSFSQIAIGTDGQVLTSGGAGVAPSFENAASGFSDPMTTRGDIIYRNSSNTTTRLGVGAANEVIRSDGTDPSWGAVQDATNSVKGIASLDEDSFAVSSGDVKPKLIGFRAHNSAGDSLANGATIICNTEAYDTGSDYNTITGVFTAPVAGYYHFDVAVAFGSVVNGGRYGFRLTGSTFGLFLTILQLVGNTGTIYPAGSADVHLAASETVTLTVLENQAGSASVLGSTTEKDATFWNGRLIAKD